MVHPVISRKKSPLCNITVCFLLLAFRASSVLDPEQASLFYRSRDMCELSTRHPSGDVGWSASGENDTGWAQVIQVFGWEVLEGFPKKNRQCSETTHAPKWKDPLTGVSPKRPRCSSPTFAWPTTRHVGGSRPHACPRDATTCSPCKT